MRAVMSGQVITARDLSGVHLGARIRFLWNFPTSNAEATVTGQLREVLHAFTEEGAVLRVLGDTDGEHSADEFTIPRHAAVTILKEGYEP